ncbi:hypothetical protein IV203_029274 [Nitzschia inconspicua]|uniref:SWIM-type domain-containing protein n=2 Tax=Nitzschia inconspicua TaxID=303405 RepID=A0A9K3KCP4_9STRA|nr:hypothetical protein IV203_023131 [Nitzschia inconspicua]KAG7366604.1 hypothetical protein IV203_029274 [Nitzschia inconspicua]
MTSTISETPSFRSSDPPAPHLTPPMPPPEGDSSTIVPIPPLQAHAPDPPTAHTSLDDIEDDATPTDIDKSDAQFASASTTPASALFPALENSVPSAVVPADNPYTSEQVAVIESIAVEASSLFCVGANFNTPDELRESLRKFAHKKGFSITSIGKKFHCSRCAEPACYIRKRLKRMQQNAPEKRRKTQSTRVGCTFQVSYSDVNYKDKEDKSIKINGSTCYQHSNGCFPCNTQLTIEKRKAGIVTVAVNESRIKSILTVMATGQRIPTGLLRDLIRPLYPPGTSLDTQLLFNFRVKRHLFANHIIKRFPGHLDYQGNAPAEANHASIVARIGSLVMEPVSLINSLMVRHVDISSERSHYISGYHLKCQGRAVTTKCESTIKALKGLSSWGFSFYEKAAKHAKTLIYSRNHGGSHCFAHCDGSTHLILPAAAEHCSCPVWVATGGTTQCSHLLLVQGGFCRENWGARWHQRTSLGKSENKGNSWEQIQRLDDHPLEGDDLSMQDGGFGDGDESVSPQQEAVATTPGSRPETVALVNSPSAEYGLSEMHTIARDLVNSIDKVRDKTKKDLFLGTLVKLADVANGNMEQFHNESL